MGRGRNWFDYTERKRLKRLRRRLWVLQDGRCPYCGAQMLNDIQQKDSPRYASMDRIVPHNLGGKYEAMNLLLACRECNTLRGDQPIFRFVLDYQSEATAT